MKISKVPNPIATQFLDIYQQTPGEIIIWHIIITGQGVERRQTKRALPDGQMLDTPDLLEKIAAILRDFPKSGWLG